MLKRISLLEWLCKMSRKTISPLNTIQLVQLQVFTLLMKRQILHCSCAARPMICLPPPQTGGFMRPNSSCRRPCRASQLVNDIISHRSSHCNINRGTGTQQNFWKTPWIVFSSEWHHGRACSWDVHEAACISEKPPPNVAPLQSAFQFSNENLQVLCGKNYTLYVAFNAQSPRTAWLVELRGDRKLPLGSALFLTCAQNCESLFIAQQSTKNNRSEPRSSMVTHLSTFTPGMLRPPWKLELNLSWFHCQSRQTLQLKPVRCLLQTSSRVTQAVLSRDRKIVTELWTMFQARLTATQPVKFFCRTQRQKGLCVPQRIFRKHAKYLCHRWWQSWAKGFSRPPLSALRLSSTSHSLWFRLSTAQVWWAEICLLDSPFYNTDSRCLSTKIPRSVAMDHTIRLTVP